jgi:hypothetical protein
MARWVLVLVLAVVSTTAWAQAPDSARLVGATAQAQNTSSSAERRVSQLAARRNTLAQRYQSELDEVGRLKTAKRSWRRDRDLSDKLAEANETAKQLEVVTRELARAQQQLVAARRALVAAIDRELAAGPNGPRKAQLERVRAQVAPRPSKARRIVLPDLQVDPLADPEELDQQARALRDAELELQAQIKQLDGQAQQLERIAMLRKQHDRTREMDQREDNPARRNTAGRGERGEAATLDTSSGPEPRPGDAGAPPPSFEMDASITLAEVVDPATIDSLKSAQRSGDPQKRADAARRTRDAVAKKLEQLRGQRKQVETRASELRKR